MLKDVAIQKKLELKDELTKYLATKADILLLKAEIEAKLEKEVLRVEKEVMNLEIRILELEAKALKLDKKIHYNVFDFTFCNSLSKQGSLRISGKTFRSYKVVV